MKNNSFTFGDLERILGDLDFSRIVVKGSRNVEFFYTVNGVRKTHKHLKPTGPGNEFVPHSADL